MYYIYYTHKHRYGFLGGFQICPDNTNAANGGQINTTNRQTIKLRLLRMDERRNRRVIRVDRRVR